MARLLQIWNCWQCDECLSLPLATGEDPQRVCARKNDRPVFEHGYFIPPWCPLPEAEEATDEQ